MYTPIFAKYYETFLSNLYIHKLFYAVTPRYKEKSECIEYMCAKNKLHTCIDSVNTKTVPKAYREH
jgi:hypothetical protein